MGRLARRHWIVLLTIAVVALAAFAVYRTQSSFGSHAGSGAPGAMPDQIVPFNPKRVLLEVFGSTGASATITYLDVNATPQRVDTTLPWAYQASTTVPAVLTNIQAQTDGSNLSCRITIDGVVKVEQSSEGDDAYVFCLDKSG
ncbi:MAG: transport acessory protein MmpS [Mycobacterium sp.]|nr:transport acessory protein MmpS [Mycobacterium sp.]